MDLVHELPIHAPKWLRNRQDNVLVRAICQIADVLSKEEN